MNLRRVLLVWACLCLLAVSGAQAQMSDADLIAEAESAAPEVISKAATVKTSDGKVLRKGTNGWTCYPGSDAIGPMCNEPQWDAVLAALMNRERIKI